MIFEQRLGHLGGYIAGHSSEWFVFSQVKLLHIRNMILPCICRVFRKRKCFNMYCMTSLNMQDEKQPI